MSSLRIFSLSIALPLSAIAPLAAAAVNVMHWWVSPGEQASIQVIQQYQAERGIDWVTTARKGSGTSNYMDAV